MGSGLPRHQATKPSSSSAIRNQKHINAIFIVIVGVALVCLFLLDGSRRWLHLTKVESIEDAVATPAAQDQLQQITEISELLSSEVDLSHVSTLFVIPGGGTGSSTAGSDSSSSPGYPEWTRRRVVAAHDAWRKDGGDGGESSRAAPRSLFLALSAGSLNSANLQMTDKRIIFESQHTVQHLKSLGVRSEVVFADFFSWDTVTNALYLRMFIEGVLALKGLPAPVDAPSPSSSSPSADKNKDKDKDGVKKVLSVKVFISDFHAERTKAAMSWVLGCSPSLLNHVHLLINVVSSEGIDFGGKGAFNDRLRHEQAGVATLMKNARTIATREQLYAFTLLGGHKGLRNYLSGSYQTSQGPGW